MKQINLLVCGYNVIIDYKNDKVILEEGISPQIGSNINTYLIREGFLDITYVDSMKNDD